MQNAVGTEKHSPGGQHEGGVGREMALSRVPEGEQENRGPASVTARGPQAVTRLPCDNQADAVRTAGPAPPPTHLRLGAALDCADRGP